MRTHGQFSSSCGKEPGRSCGLASFYGQGIDSKSLAAHLLERHDIFVSTPEDDWHPADEAMLDGRVAVRVAPNVFSSAREIDRFVEAVHEVLQSGLPADRKAQGTWRITCAARLDQEWSK